MSGWWMSGWTDAKEQTDGYMNGRVGGGWTDRYMKGGWVEVSGMLERGGNEN